MAGLPRLGFQNVAGMNGSGDILADRRFDWARALIHEGDHAAAADLLEQIVDIVPGWCPAWAALAEVRQRLGETEAATAAWRKAAAIDRDGRLGAKLHLARLTGEAPSAMPGTYVRALFDDYAPRFDRHLTEQLDYRGPQILAEVLAEVAPDRCFARALDLGCGTGLMARALERCVAAIDGVDLSPKMIDAARRTGLYSELTVGSLEAAVSEAAPDRYDLVTAADVVVYLGDLAPLMVGVARVLVPRGLFAFTVQLKPDPAEAHATEGMDTADKTVLATPGFVLGPDLRFAHSRLYVKSVVASAGLRLLSIVEASTRTEKGIAVPGLVVLAGRH